MPDTMTTRERIARILAHQEADRVPVADIPWPSTLERWRREGLPLTGDWEDHVGTDKIVTITPDNSPRYPVQVLEETERYRVYTSQWGGDAAPVESCRRHTPSRGLYRTGPRLVAVGQGPHDA